MAGTVTITEEAIYSVRKIKFAWVAAGGSADGTTTLPFTGAIERLVTVPSTAGTQPDDNYDVVVNDEDGNDVLMGAGANRDETNTEQVLASSLGVVTNDKLTLAVTNAGATNAGTVYLYIR